MPTMDEYAKSGGYARDAEISKNFANVTIPSSYSPSSKKKTPTPQTGGYMNVPMAGGSSGGGVPSPSYLRDKNNNIVGEVGADGNFNIYNGGYSPLASAQPKTPTPPMPSSYQVGDVTYTPGPANWGNMSQSDRNAYAGSIASASGSKPPMPNYRVTADMGMGGTPPSYSATQGTGGTPAFPVKTAAEIAAEAKARTDALLAKQTTLASQTKTGFQTSFDRLKATTKDDRVIQDSSFQRSSNPFSGQTDYRASMMDRERERTDREASQDLATRMANVDMSLADYTTANEAERMKMEDEMMARERQYGIQVDQLALQRRGQDQNQFNADRSFGLQQDQFQHGVGQDQIRNGQWGQTFNQNQSNADRQYDAGRQDTAYNRGQDQIKNDRNAANDALALRKQHIDEANYISDKYNIHIDPKDDYQLMLDQAAGLPTAAEKTAAQKAEDTRKSEAWKRIETLGSVQSQADADLLNIPVGTQTQKAKQDAMDNAIKSRNADASIARANRPAAEKPPAQTKPMSAGAYKTNPDFADEIATIQANPSNALSQVQAHAQALIQAYGYEGYQELVQAATPK